MNLILKMLIKDFKIMYIICDKKCVYYLYYIFFNYLFGKILLNGKILWEFFFMILNLFVVIFMFI